MLSPLGWDIFTGFSLDDLYSGQRFFSFQHIKKSPEVGMMSPDVGLESSMPSFNVIVRSWQFVPGALVNVPHFNGKQRISSCAISPASTDIRSFEVLEDWLYFIGELVIKQFELFPFVSKHKYLGGG
ncbi:MAG: hypothetical protein MJA29_01195 [Candidatus Omnitrophica bacterium]|nr:hypothetical protein [Candidatus Omnitrophota bacterium]